MTIFGFPADYWLTLVIGWLVLIPVFWIYVEISEKIDQEINDSSSGQADIASGGHP
jgi:putative solute:sodium symporter small subunit